MANSLRVTMPDEECGWVVITQCETGGPALEWCETRTSAEAIANETLVTAKAEQWGRVNVWVLECRKQGGTSDE